MGLTIKLSEEQVQRTLNILGQAPYMEIADVINTIKTQSNEQLIGGQSDETTHQ